MNLANMIELANHISESLNAHYQDVNDIDFMIEELNKKRKGVARRMERDAAHLRTIITDATFSSGVSSTVLDNFKEALDGVDELVEIVNKNITGL